MVLKVQVNLDDIKKQHCKCVNHIRPEEEKHESNDSKRQIKDTQSAFYF